jgi:hypothetical protein
MSQGKGLRKGDFAGSAVGPVPTELMASSGKHALSAMHRRIQCLSLSGDRSREPRLGLDIPGVEPAQIRKPV